VESLNQNGLPWESRLSRHSHVKAVARKETTLRQTFLALFVCFALAAAAQQGNPTSKKQLALGDSPPTFDSSEVNSTLADAYPQAPKPAPSQEKKPAQVGKLPEPEGPPVDASMVGYIDNAIVGSEVRIRFDAAFNDSFPDRAEFIYGKCGCYQTLFKPGDANYDPHAPGPRPGVPKNVNFQVVSFMGEYAPTRRFSTFIQIPFRWLQPEGLVAGLPGETAAFSNGAGISDIEVGLKFALLASPTRYLTAQLTSYFPSGSALHGLGTNHYSLEPALLYYQRFGESKRFEVEGELGGWLPTGGSAGVATVGTQGFAGNIFFYGIGPSFRVINGEQFRLAPVIELVGWSVTGGLQTGPASASGTNIVNLKMGARMAFRGHNSLYVGYGHALTSADWYDNILRVEYRYAF
jgi:hypothetical protein